MIDSLIDSPTFIFFFSFIYLFIFVLSSFFHPSKTHLSIHFFPSLLAQIIEPLCLANPILMFHSFIHGSLLSNSLFLTKFLGLQKTPVSLLTIFAVFFIESWWVPCFQSFLWGFISTPLSISASFVTDCVVNVPNPKPHQGEFWSSLLFLPFHLFFIPNPNLKPLKPKWPFSPSHLPKSNPILLTLKNKKTPLSKKFHYCKKTMQGNPFF